MTSKREDERLERRWRRANATLIVTVLVIFGLGVGIFLLLTYG
jgi:hypothetical protein